MMKTATCNQIVLEEMLQHDQTVDKIVEEEIKDFTMSAEQVQFHAQIEARIQEIINACAFTQATVSSSCLIQHR